MILLAVDPSTTCTGLALFRNGVLSWVGHAKWRGEAPLALRCLQMVTYSVSLLPFMPREVALEWPQVYTPDKSQGDPNDLPGIAAVGVGICAALPVRPMVVAHYTPGEWTCQVKKTVGGRLSSKTAKTSPRALVLRDRLLPEEVAVWDRAKTHDEIDAVGIGLHHLRRGIAHRQRVYPGAV